MVVVVPVHPHPEAARLLGDDLAVLRNSLFAPLGELGQPVVLDLPLRVQPERLLDLDLDPEALAVEAVLVALVEAPERLVADEDVLQGAAPGVVDAHRVVGRDRPVDEAPALAAAVLLAQLVEDLLLVPPREDVLLEDGMVRNRRKLGERLGHRVRFYGRSGTAKLGLSLQGEANGKELRMSTAVTESTFEEEVLQSDKPVIVDFWAEWCGPCHAVSPVLEKIADERGDELKLVKVDIDEEQGLAERYGIASIPTIVLFRDGEPAAAAIGAQPKGAIERQLGLVEAEAEAEAS